MMVNEISRKPAHTVAELASCTGNARWWLSSDNSYVAVYHM